MSIFVFYIKDVYMKKQWFYLISIWAVALFSCSKEAENTELPQLENSFQYGQIQNKIGSVLYTLEETEGYHTFYVSPTVGIKDMEVMLMADDYIKLAVDNVSGTVDLLGGGSLVKYKGLELSKASSAGVLKADLEVKLTSERTVSIILDAETNSGEILRINYYGLCTKWPVNQAASYDVRLDKTIYSIYFGQLDPTSEICNYYLTLTDGTFEMAENTYTMTSPGHVLVLDLYAKGTENWRDIPTGVFESNSEGADHTYGIKYSGVRHYPSASSTGTQYTLSGPVTIEHVSEGIYTVTASFLGENNVEQSMIYTGELKLTNGTANYYLPQHDGDMYIDGKYAEAIYNGDLFESGSGAMSIQIWDENYELDGANGYSATLMIFGKLFVESEIEIEPGRYAVGTTFTRGTWMPCAELSLMGMIIPMGTYGHKDTGTEYGLFAYAADGTIDIETTENEGEYHITFDLLTAFGDKIQGEYTGAVTIYDESDDSAKDDGTSTLEADYDMDLSYIPQAHLYTPDEIYVNGIGYCEFNEYDPAAPYCLQDIRFSSEWLHELPGEGIEPKEGDRFDGDIVKLQIIGDPTDPKRIVPGTYPVVPQRWPAYFQPGVCVPGTILGDEGFIGSSWQHLYKDYYKSTDSEGNEIIKTNGGFMDGHACIYGGTLKISKPEGVAENVFTFEFDGICVRKHHVRGTWTGPVIGATYKPGLSYGEEEGDETTSPSAVHGKKSFVSPSVLREAAAQMKEVPYRPSFQK